MQAWAWRRQQRARLAADPAFAASAKTYYATRPVAFLNHWIDTYDPRRAAKGLAARIPLILFPRQAELVEFLLACLQGEASGLIEKCRDMGATWVCVGVSVWLWLFWPGAAIGWGSRKEELVDRLGDPKSVFEKIRGAIDGLPPAFLPAGFVPRLHASFMKVVNPETGASIAGEAGDNIGRGGRTLLYFKDESAHYERPEKIEAALLDNTRVQIDLSSVNGLGNVFHRRRESGVEWRAGQAVVRDRVNVFVMDWRDHPEKTQSWYDARKAKAEAEGLAAVFAQEVDRRYASSSAGVLLQPAWVRAAIDAHKTLGIPETGLWGAALDAADEGADRSALVLRRGLVLKAAEQWADGDTGATARKAVDLCQGHGALTVQYDCVGVGAGVKAETNRLAADGVLPQDLRFVPWNGGDAVQNPKRHVVRLADGSDDLDSPRNEDFYANRKAQGWWELRGRFLRTFRAVQAGARFDPAAGRVVGPDVTFDPDDLIAIDGAIPLLRQIEKELCQPTAGKGSRLKLAVNKTPPGARSPNLGDAIMMAYFPLEPVSAEVRIW